jgi:hypothetical protein
MSKGGSVRIGIVPGSGGFGREAEEVKLSQDDRYTHTYICGITRQGKSKLLESMIRQDILANRTTGSGLIVFDPHASLVKPTLRWMARYRLTPRMVVIDLARDEWVVGISPLRHDAGEAIDKVATRFVESIGHVWNAASTTDTPLFSQWAKNVAYALLHKGMTLAEASALLQSGRLAEKRWLTADLPLESIAGDWKQALAMKEADYKDMIGSTARRLNAILSSQQLLRIVGQVETIDWRRAMDEGWIIFFAFSSSVDADSHNLATMIITSLWHAASKRDKEKHPRRFHVYLDEFERFVTPSMAQSLAEAAGFGLALTMAHQFPHQLKHSGPHGERLLHEVFNNAQTKITFKVAYESAELLAREMRAERDAIMSLTPRSLLVTRPSHPTPEPVETTDVPVSAVNDKVLNTWIDRQMGRWKAPFIQRRDDAIRAMSGRLAAAMQTKPLPEDDGGECKTSRKPVRRT